MADDRHRLAAERHLGLEEGEAYDRRLRERERVEREERLSRIAWAADAATGAVAGTLAALEAPAPMASPAPMAPMAPTAPIAPAEMSDLDALATFQVAGDDRDGAATGALPPAARRPLAARSSAAESGWPARDEPGRPIVQPTLGSLYLQREVERLTFFYNAVQNSRAWRLTQRLRRLVGRAW
jgi:hypothetical protein